MKPHAVSTASRQIATWIGLGVASGLACGIASAVFLESLDWVTRTRSAHAVIVFTLPVAGFLVGLLYEIIGKPIRAGYGLVLDTFHAGGPRIPLRMAPLVLIGTLLTHLFGGSAGREGTAVQMGASLSDGISHALGLPAASRRQIIAAGMAGGFGSVFGTPIAGAMFGLEVVRVGRVEYDALLPALVASIVGDVVTRALGVVHTPYPIVKALPLSPALAAKWLLFGLAAGAVVYAFVELTHTIKKRLESRIAQQRWRMALGGLVVVGLWQLCRTDAYLGLGVPTIVASFTDTHLPLASFAWKLAFTAVTIGAGFLGGEVTPLFFVGATFGNAMGRALCIPIDMAAAVGMAAVFGAAANTPIALSIMAVELVGSSVLPHVVLVTVVAYLVTGHRGIYPSQRLGLGKLFHGSNDPETKLSEVR